MGNQPSQQAYQQYYNTLQNPPSLTVSDVNPYAILGVSKTFTWNELKNAYRRTAILVHPDKGGSEQLFALVTECFRKLSEDYQFRTGGRVHHELKAEAQEYYSREPAYGEGGSGSTREGTRGSGDARDPAFMERFNRVFEENRLAEDENERGYGTQMAASSKVREDINIPRAMKKFNNDKFNRAFEDTVQPASQVMVKYKEPEPMLLARKMQFSELGGQAPDDFTSGAADGTNGARRGLQYTDYMRAHTTARLVDPRTVEERRQFKTVEEYEAYRERKTKREMTAKEEAYMVAKKKQEEAAEAERLARLRQRDDVAALHHEKLNRLMLGGR